MARTREKFCKNCGAPIFEKMEWDGSILWYHRPPGVEFFDDDQTHRECRTLMAAPRTHQMSRRAPHRGAYTTAELNRAMAMLREGVSIRTAAESLRGFDTHSGLGRALYDAGHRDEIEGLRRRNMAQINPREDEMDEKANDRCALGCGRPRHNLPAERIRIGSLKFDACEGSKRGSA